MCDRIGLSALLIVASAVYPHFAHADAILIREDDDPEARARLAHSSDWAEIDETLNLLHELHGTTDRCWVRGRSVTQHDFNGDGRNEWLVLFHIADEPILRTFQSAQQLDTSSHGFALFSKVRNRWWPVYFYLNEFGFSLSFRKFEGLGEEEILVSEGGRNNTQSVWYFDRSWVAPKRTSGVWRAGWRDVRREPYGPFKVLPSHEVNMSRDQ